MKENFNVEKPAFFGEKRFYQASTWLKENFGKKTIKLAIDGGFTCPNRDGSKGYGGCTFCSDSGSGEFASHVEDQIKLLSDKWPNAKYLGYFQNHTNTYAPVSELREKYYAILNNPKIEGLVIGTRPDCLSGEVLDLLEEILDTNIIVPSRGLKFDLLQMAGENAIKAMEDEIATKISAEEVNVKVEAAVAEFNNAFNKTPEKDGE